MFIQNQNFLRWQDGEVALSSLSSKLRRFLGFNWIKRIPVKYMLALLLVYLWLVLKVCWSDWILFLFSWRICDGCFADGACIVWLKPGSNTGLVKPVQTIEYNIFVTFRVIWLAYNAQFVLIWKVNWVLSGKLQT